MVFGHYTIPLKTIAQNQLPPNLQAEPGTKVQCSIRVFHILWIPIFPFSKLWLMKKGGEAYKVTPEAEQLFNQLYGRPKTPFYAFSGIILAVLFFGYMSFKESANKRKYARQATERKEAQRNERLGIIQNATLDNYFVFTNKDGKYYGAKVEGVMDDSILLKYVTPPTAAKHGGEGHVLRQFVYDENDYAFTTVSKASLSDALNLATPEKKGDDFEGAVVGDMVGGSALQLQNIITATPDKIDLKITDEKVTEEIRAAMTNFFSDQSIDFSLEHIDQASKDYLLEVIKIARNDIPQEMKDYINRQECKSANYNIMLNTKYVYVESMGEKLPKDKDELLKDYGFFSKLIGVGLWTLDAKVEPSEIRTVTVKNKTHATARVFKTANILENQFQSIQFDVDFTKEDGIWKINLPSTWRYTEYQVMKAGSNYNGGHAEYRKMVMNQLTSGKDNQLMIDPVLVY